MSEEVNIVTLDGRVHPIPRRNSARFNRTTESIDWARWTWNPVTGCNRGCEYCYARASAHTGRMAPYYPFEFEPCLHEYRLDAPVNTKCPNTGDARDRRVFVCSMADLFAEWVPPEWIEKVFAACAEAPDWQYAFLTKSPQRYSQVTPPEGAWLGATVENQNAVERTAEAMQKVKGYVRWCSLEPLTEPIAFSDLSWCDWMVVGAQTATRQPGGARVPAIAPDFGWIVDIWMQCKEAGIPCYLKANLANNPGMTLPKEQPIDTGEGRKGFGCVYEGTTP